MSLSPTQRGFAEVYSNRDLPGEALADSASWLLEPIIRATSFVQTTPFFSWLRNITQVQEFSEVSRQLFHHSITLPRAIGLMLAATSRHESHLYKLYASHAHEEADHHLLALNWMLQHGIVSSRAELDAMRPTTETTSCINIAYHIAVERDHDMWIATMNTAIERCFWLLFCEVASKMKELGAGHEYFDVHVTADEHHSTAGLAYLSKFAPQSPRAALIVGAALEGISLWTSMIHSWIGMSFCPIFNLDGTLRKPPTCDDHCTNERR